MMATIYMVFDDDPNEWAYGSYPFNTMLEKNRVNEIADKIKKERNCGIRIAVNKNNI